MKPLYAFFAARRYWPRPEAAARAMEALLAKMPGGGEDRLFWDDQPLSLPRADLIVLAPLSGGVQSQMLSAASVCPSAVVYASYMRGNSDREAEEGMLRANAAPAFMDTWAVLRRSHPHCRAALTPNDLAHLLRLHGALLSVRSARILQIGERENWVVSTAASRETYQALLGVEIVPVFLDEVESRFRAATRDEAQPYRDWFISHSQSIMEPTQDDIWAASRMAFSLDALLTDYAASGAALSCFRLLSTGVNMCLAVSWANDRTPRFVSCEGDMDSAVTMLMMKKLARGRLWMANPALYPDGLIHFSHCTAPICLLGEPLPTILRSHHESGIGVSLQVDIPAGLTATLCRVSGERGEYTVQRGVTVPGPYLPACRTQSWIRLDDMDHYVSTALGCHQVISFEDMEEDFSALASGLGLTRL